MDSFPGPFYASTARNTRSKASQEPPGGSTTIASSSPVPRPQTNMPHSSENHKPNLTTTGGSFPGKPYSSSRAMERDRASRSPGRDSLAMKVTKPRQKTPSNSKDGEVLQTLKGDLDDLRALVTCKICDRLLYEPYVISCGHTYCYSCLCSWFVNNKARKTCPDCRVVVTSPPAPAYLVREMTLIFVRRAELLPAGESLEEHAKWQKEELDIVQTDKNNTDARTGGLFRGCFRRHHTRPIRAFRDEEDGVDRCPFCSWELEDGACLQCGEFDNAGDGEWGDGFGGFSDMDETSEHDMSDEELDGEVDMEDNDAELGFDEHNGTDADFDDFWPDQYFENMDAHTIRRWLANGGPRQGAPRAANVPRRRAMHSAAGRRRHSYSASLVSDMPTEDTEMGTVEEDDEDTDDEDSSMNDFIDDHESGEDFDDSSSSSSRTPQPSINASQQRRPRRVVDSESEAPSVSDAAEEDEDNEEAPIPAGRRRQQVRGLTRARTRRQQSTAPSYTTGSVSSEDDREDPNQALMLNGWSPLAQTPSNEDMEEEDDDSDESGGESTTVGWEPIPNSNNRSRTGGSLTPAADRQTVSTLSATRIANPPLPGGFRGPRRSSTVLSVSTATYEGANTDDEFETENDGEVSMNGAALGISFLHTPQGQDSQEPGAIYDDQEQVDSTIPIARLRNLGRHRSHRQTPSAPRSSLASDAPFSPPASSGITSSRNRNPSIDSNITSESWTTLSYSSRREVPLSRASTVAQVSVSNGVPLSRQLSIVSLSSDATLDQPATTVRSSVCARVRFGSLDSTHQSDQRNPQSPPATARRARLPANAFSQSLVTSSLSSFAARSVQNQSLDSLFGASYHSREPPSAAALRVRASQTSLHSHPSQIHINLERGGVQARNIRPGSTHSSLRAQQPQHALHDAAATAGSSTSSSDGVMDHTRRLVDFDANLVGASAAGLRAQGLLSRANNSGSTTLRTRPPASRATT